MSVAKKAGTNGRKAAAEGRRETAEPSLLKLEGNLAYRLSILNFLVGKATARIYGEADLTTNQWKILSILHGYAPMPALAIAKRVTLDKAAISRTVQQLLRLGLVQRNLRSSETSVIEISMTAAGRRLYARIGRRTAALQAELLKEIGESERRLLFGVFDRIEAEVRRAAGR
jgi:DNA-binding MarR family transcriptional regulator